MHPVIAHAWDLSSEAAAQLQSTLATQVITQDRGESVRLIAGVDVSYAKAGDTLAAAVVIVEAGSLTAVETVVVKDVARFPYVPGLFSFRELPPLLQALAKLQHTPDLVICDGQGIAHPRGFGLASHLGVLFDIPTIGCGKTRLVGEHAAVGGKRGDTAPLVHHGVTVGAAVRTQDGVNPIYASIGHRVSLASACHWILVLSNQYRLPEPIRLADRASRRALLT